MSLYVFIGLRRFLYVCMPLFLYTRFCLMYASLCLLIHRIRDYVCIYSCLYIGFIYLCLFILVSAGFMLCMPLYTCSYMTRVYVCLHAYSYTGFVFIYAFNLFIHRIRVYVCLFILIYTQSCLCMPLYMSSYRGSLYIRQVAGQIGQIRLSGGTGPYEGNVEVSGLGGRFSWPYSHTRAPSCHTVTGNGNWPYLPTSQVTVTDHNCPRHR